MAPLFTGYRFGFGLGPLVGGETFIPDAGTYLNYGWYAGGGGRNTTVDRIDWASDLSTASTRSGIDADATNGGGLSNLSYGWFGGGYNPSFDPNGGRSTVSRVDYVNDLSGTSTRAPTPNSANSRTGGFSNTNYGYWGTGMSGNGGAASSVVTRVDFSNDTASPANRTNAVNQYVNHTGGASNFSTYGWFIGGVYGGAGGVSGPPLSSMHRLTYASDTSALSTRGNLTAVGNGRACGNQTYAWIGGKNGPASSAIERMTFLNDLATATIRGNLSSARDAAGSGNNTYIWWAAGYGPAVGNVATVDRMSYENDLAAVSTRGSLSSGRQANAGNHMTLG